jgi:hypothetical protein
VCRPVTSPRARDSASETWRPCAQPESLSYVSGDYLGVVPINVPSMVGMAHLTMTRPLADVARARADPADGRRAGLPARRAHRLHQTPADAGRAGLHGHAGARAHVPPRYLGCAAPLGHPVSAPRVRQPASERTYAHWGTGLGGSAFASYASGAEKTKLEFLASNSPLAAQEYNRCARAAAAAAIQPHCVAALNACVAWCSWVFNNRMTPAELIDIFPSIRQGKMTPGSPRSQGREACLCLCLCLSKAAEQMTLWMC